MPIKIKPVIVAEDGVNEFKDSKSKIKTVIVAEDGINTVKKKEPTVLPSEQSQESTTSVTPKATEQKPSVSSSSKDDNLFSGYPGKEAKKYKLDNSSGVPVWKEYSSTIPKENGKNIDLYEKSITDPNRVSALNKHFNQNASSSELEKVYTGYPGKEKNEYRVIDNTWQRKSSKDKSWVAINNEGSIKSLNTKFDEKVEFMPLKSKYSGAVVDKYKESQDKFDNNLLSINSTLIGKEEDEVVKTLQVKFPDFKFNKTGLLTDELRVISPNGQVKVISLDNINDEDDAARSTELRNWMNVNSSKDLASATKKLNELEGVNLGYRYAKPGDVEYVEDSPYGQRLIPIDNKTVFEKLGVEDPNKQAAIKVARKEFVKEQAKTFVNVSESFRNKKVDEKEVAAAFAAIPHDKETARRVNEYSKDVLLMSKSHAKVVSDIDAYAKDINDKLESGEITKEQYDSIYKPDIEQQIQKLNDKSNELKGEISTINNLSKSLDKSLAESLIIEESKGTIVGGVVKSLVKGASYLPRLASGGGITSQDQKDLVDLITGKGTTENYMASEDRSDITKALFSLSESLGAMASGGGIGAGAEAAIGGVAGKIAGSAIPFYGQSYYGMKDELDKIPNMTETEKVLMSSVFGLGSSILEKFGLDTAMGNTVAGKSIVSTIMKSALKEIPKEATKEMIEASIENSAKNYLKQIGKGLLTEAATEVTQGALELGVKESYDYLKNTEYFNNESAWDITKNILYQGYLGALGGGIMSTVSQTSKLLTSNKSVSKDQAQTLINVASIEDINNTITASLKTKILSGDITKEEAKDIQNSFNEIQSKVKQIPEGMSDDKKVESLNLLIEKSNLTKEIAGKDEALVSKQKDRINAINEELKTISNKPEEDATKESEQPIQEVSTESNISEYQGTESGQQEVGQAEGSERTTTQPEANISDSNIPSEAEVEIDRLRAEEQKELVKAIPGIETYKTDDKVDKNLMPEDTKQIYEEIYDRYDALITPLLKEQEQPTVTPTTKVEEEANADINAATDANQLAKMYNEEVNSLSSINPKEKAIHSVISKIKRDSYLRFGDVNGITDGMAKTYFNKNGQSIDQVAQDASALLSDNASVDAITPQDIVDYINKYKSGFNPAAPSGNARLKAINEKNIELTGKKLNSRIARTRAMNVGKEVELEQVESKLYEAIQTAGLLATMDENINDESFWTTFPGGFTKEEYELIKKEYNETSREELTRIESEIQSIANWDSEDAIISTDAIEEGTTETPTFEDVKDLDVTNKTNLKKVQSFLDNAINDLDAFGKETLGMNLPVAVARAVLKAVKTLVDAGVSLEKAFKQASQDAGVSEVDVIDAIKLVKESYKAGAAKATGDLKPIIDFLKDKAKLTKNAKTGLALAVKDLVKSGKINSVQSASIVKRFNSVNTARQESIDNFLAFVERVYNRADYAQKFTEATSLKKSINKARKNAAGSVNAIAKEFGKIDLSIVSDIDKYIEIATELKNATKSNRTQTSSSITGITQTFDTEISSRKAISIEDLQKYIEGELNKQEKQQLDRAKKRYEEYVTDGSLPANITLEEVNALMKELKGKINDAEFDAKAESIASVIKKEFLDRKSIVEDMIVNGGVNPLTGEQVDFSPEQEVLIKKLLSADIETLSKKEMFVALDGMDNFLTNGITDGLKRFVAIQEGRANRTELINSGIKARDLRMYFSNALARFKFKQLDDVNKTLERMFGGISKGDKVANALGFTKVRNGVAKTDKQVNNINQAFTTAFKGKRPNGKHFNDVSNTYERGVWSNLFRSPIGSEFAKSEALKKRIQEVKSSYENLISSTDKQKQKEGEIIKAVFDKLNLSKENITIEEIAENVDPANQEGVDWMIDKWSELYPEMSDKSLGFDNIVLEQEDNYTPDIVRSVVPEADSSLGENITQTNPFVNDPSRRVNTSKAGVLYASTKVGMGKSKYLSFDFDNNNIKKMREALLDLNISEGAYQMQEALKNNEELIKLIPNAADMNMIRGKMYAYVNNAKGSTIKDSIDIKLADNILNRLAKASTSMGLSAISQIPTQTIGVAMNTISQAGEFWELGAAFNKDVNNFIDRTGRPIANRGKEATTTIESATRYIDKNPDTWYKVIDKTVGDINDSYLNATLQTPDRIIARASFIAYYKKSLKRQGLNYKNIDWKNLEVNDVAADYAETMVSRQQTSSDPYNKGAVFTNKTAAIKILKNTLLPFAGFSINQHSRMVNDIVLLTQRRAESTTQDKIDATRSLAGWAFEQLAYHAVNYAIIQAIYYAMSDEDEEDQKKRRAFEKDTRLTKIIGDILSPIPQVNDIINGGINYALESKLIGSYLGVNKKVDEQIKKINDARLEEGDEVMGIKEEFAKRKELQQELSYQLKTFDNKNPYGLYGVTYDKFHDFELLFGDKYTGEVEVPKYGGDGTITKYLIPEDRDKLLAPMIVDALYLSGAVRLRELHKYSTIKRKELEKNRSLTAKEYDIYSELKKDKKFDPNTYQFDLIKSGKDLYWIQDEIKWINENGGLNNKEGSEYGKLRELYIKDKQGYSVNDDDLKMLQQGKTAEYVFNKSKK